MIVSQIHYFIHSRFKTAQNHVDSRVSKILWYQFDMWTVLSKSFGSQIRAV